MPIGIRQFEIQVQKHPSEARENSDFAWLILVHVKFNSANPRNWGELRAYGGAWRRRFGYDDVTFEDKLHQTESQLVIAHETDEDHQLKFATHLPFWGHPQGPSKPPALEWRLGNDQHIEIFYRRPIRHVRRSNPNLAAPNQEPDPLHYFLDVEDADTPATALRPHEIQLHLWDIVGRDEPAWTGVNLRRGEGIEYWHQAEFQILRPASVQVIARKRLFCRVWGTHGLIKYEHRIS